MLTDLARPRSGVAAARALLVIGMLAALASAQAASSDAYRAGSFSSYSPRELQHFVGEQLRSDGRPPLDYVVEKFRDHDIVFLGESPHKVQQNLQFLQALIPKLYAAGVRHLGYEMLRSQVQPQIDAVVTGKTFDQELANFLTYEWEYDNFGAYEEYRDVLRAAWALNAALPAGAPKFRIVGLDYWYKVTDESQLRAGEKGNDPAVIQRHLGLQSRDGRWAALIESQFIQKGHKALIYAGNGHATTRFYWDQGFGTHERTAGNLIHDLIGARAFTISLHGAEETLNSAFIESIIEKQSAAAQPFGIDLRRGTPLGDMWSPKAGYIGTGRGSNAPTARSGGFVMADVIDGYVYLTPMSQFRMAKRIAGMLNPVNVKEIVRRKRIDTGDRTLSITTAELRKKEEAADQAWRDTWEP